MGKRDAKWIAERESLRGRESAIQLALACKPAANSKSVIRRIALQKKGRANASSD